MALSEEQRTLRARIAAYEKWAGTSDRSEATAKARAAFNRRFEDAADPESARKAYFTRLAFESSKARRKVRGAG